MNAPLVINTADGMVWTRRTVTRDGLALYALEGVCSCPEFVMATMAELAEHGIAGSADVLPMPVVRETPTAPVLRRQLDAEAELEELRAKLAEYERPADEDPIAYALTPKAAVRDVTPQVRKLRALLAGQRQQTGGVE